MRSSPHDAAFPIAGARPRPALLVSALFLALACPLTASASYGQFKLDGLSLLLTTLILTAWGVALALALALGGGKRLPFVVFAAVVTTALAFTLVAAFEDGRATMKQRPAGMWVTYVLLLLAAAPVMLAAPIVQFRKHTRGTPTRAPLMMLLVSLALIPVGTTLHALLQEANVSRVLEQTRALTPGHVLPHVLAAPRRVAESWTNPYLWNDEAERQWIVIGLSRLEFIESPLPLAPEDTQALELLVRESAGTTTGTYTWTLESKLFWDRLVQAPGSQKGPLAAALTAGQASHFVEYIGVPHASWLCAPLSEPESAQAFQHVWSLLSEYDRPRYAAEVQTKCGRSIGVMAK